LLEEAVAAAAADTAAAAEAAAAEEVAFVESLCTQPQDTLIAVHRTYEDGNVREMFRTLRPRAGANNVLAKPFTIEKMKAAIEAVFGALK